MVVQVVTDRKITEGLDPKLARENPGALVEQVLRRERR